MIRGFVILIGLMCGGFVAADEPTSAQSDGGAQEAAPSTSESDSAGSPEKNVRPTTAPSRSPTEILQRMVKECVTITPGRGRYPQKAVIGSQQPLPHERPRQVVAIKHPFRISRYEVTQELYQLVTGKNPSRWKGPRNSVEMVSGPEAVDFARRLTTLLREQDLISSEEVVRLPTALEWEYCCRAGSKSRFSFGDDVGLPEADSETARLDQFAWHTGNAAGNDPAVGVLKPNSWGLYDMHGYLWEFVHEGSDGQEAPERDEFQIRGGSWRDPYPRLSSSSYLSVSRAFRSDAVGIRCVIARHDAGKKPAPK